MRTRVDSSKIDGKTIEQCIYSYVSPKILFLFTDNTYTCIEAYEDEYDGPCVRDCDVESYEFSLSSQELVKFGFEE